MGGFDWIIANVDLSKSDIGSVCIPRIQEDVDDTLAKLKAEIPETTPTRT